MSRDAAATEDLVAVAASLFLIDPCGLGGIRLHGPADDARSAFVAALRAGLPAEGAWVRVPSSITLDRLVGGLDLTATLAAGRVVAERGVLAAANGGIAVLASAERLAGSSIGPILHAIDTGRVVVERDGIRDDQAAQFGMVALDESEGDEPALDRALSDRLALIVRIPPRWSNESASVLDQSAVVAARARLNRVTCDDSCVKALIGAADAFGVASARAAIFAARAARASAALDERDAVEESDVERAIELVLLPRATRQPAPPDASQPPPPPPPEQEPPPDEPSTDRESTAEEKEMAERVIAAALASLPAELLSRIDGGRVRASRAGAGRSVAKAKAAMHGRTVGNEAGTPRGGRRLDLLATLRTAAPWQRVRATDAAAHGVAKGPALLDVRGTDLRVRRLAQRVGTTVIVAVDASGSAAAQRLGEAKGAVELLLAESYVRRDEVALVSFRGTSAELMLAPTRSLARAKRALAGLPGGGGTPLASAIALVTETALKVRRDGGRPLVVLLTDGRANVARDGTGGRPRAEAEAMRAAQVLGAANVPALILDTGIRPNAALKEIARVAGADYLPLPNARAETVRDAVRSMDAGTRAR